MNIGGAPLAIILAAFFFRIIPPPPITTRFFSNSAEDFDLLANIDFCWFCSCNLIKVNDVKEILQNIFLDMRLSLLHCQSGTIVEDIALHLLDLLSDLFAISEKEKMRDIYFVKRATRTAKFPGKISVFPLFFCLSKEPQMSESFLQMVSTFLEPTIGREEALWALGRLWLKFSLFVCIELQISRVGNP